MLPCTRSHAPMCPFPCSVLLFSCSLAPVSCAAEEETAWRVGQREREAARMTLLEV